ncbi:hypothetical protein SDC9_58206 [bioreactor metagenome]|uniref:Uncharacterized protein n=1 Tax=bioreactor metagenome TaxID=1076179 RepID=A0A644X6T2_9ZZZZ
MFALQEEVEDQPCSQTADEVLMTCPNRSLVDCQRAVQYHLGHGQCSCKDAEQNEKQGERTVAAGSHDEDANQTDSQTYRLDFVQGAFLHSHPTSEVKNKRADALSENR